MFAVTLTRIADLPVLRFEGALVFGPPIETLRLAVRDLGSTVSRVVIDVAALDQVDSSGIGAMLRLQGDLQRSGGGVVLVQPSEHVRSTLKTLRVEALFPAAGTAFEAARMLAENTHQ